LLLGLVLVGVALLHAVTGVEVIGAVMSLIPLIAVLWIAMQQPPVGLSRRANVRQRVLLFVTRELPSYRGEIVLLFMAGFIGSLGAFLLVPLMQAQAFDMTTIPPWIIVAAMVWIIPVTGQLGMNPILAVSLLVPILPSPEVMGIPPTAMVVAITAGWALSGATSPFTASVMLAASLGGVSPLRAGLGWNGVYTLVAGAALSLWALSLFYILWLQLVMLHAATTFNCFKRGYNPGFDLSPIRGNHHFLDLDEILGFIKPWAMSELLRSPSSELEGSGLDKAVAPVKRTKK
jgi:hypothetical protein